MNIKTQFKVCLFSLVGLLSVAATIKISDMVTATSVGNADLFTIVQGGTNKKVTQATLLTNTFANVTGGSGINVTNQGTNIVIAATGSSGGKVAQVVTTTSTTDASTSSTIPFDDTEPQSGEGAAYASLNTTITPTSASSKLIIDVNLFIGASAQSTVIFAIFKDSDASAIQTRSFGFTGNAYTQSLPIRFVVSAGSTTARTYKLRYGPTGATTAYIGGTGGSTSLFGTANQQNMTVTEVLP
jgi:hypothetical protein